MKERANLLLKRLDYAIGIPIVAILGIIKKVFFKKTHLFDKEKVKTIGIIKEAAIGDLVILSGILRDLEKTFPESKIILFCSESNQAIVDLLDLQKTIEKVVLPMSKPLEMFKKIFDLDQIDLLFDFGQWPRINAIISFFIKSKYKVGFKTKGQYRHYVYDKAVEHIEKGVHEIENFRNLLRSISIPVGEKPSLRILPSELRLPEKFVVFHLFPGGSKAALKKWHINNWIAIGKYIINKGYSIILTGGKSDSKDAEVVRWKFEHEDIDEKLVINHTGESLKDSIYILKKAKLIVSIDTGIVHIASAINANLVALYGPTDPDRWGPLSENSKVIYNKKDCSPCISLGFETKCENPECMNSISVEEVIKAIDSFL
ncbi:MAG: glycosyltransferase family 9 protein [Brevinematales bacterium]|nr:glycosyltransferase family 9 protein [Brevinematales bacterium]